MAWDVDDFDARYMMVAMCWDTEGGCLLGVENVSENLNVEKTDVVKKKKEREQHI